MFSHLVRKGLVLAALVLLVTAPPAGATDGVLPAHLGWHELPGTALRTICPPNGFGGSDYSFHDYCRNVTAAWNSAVMDTRRNRLVVWGGGHSDYLGNELYALDVAAQKITRLTDPGLPVAKAGCPESIANDTQPNARHTYDALAYIEHADRLWTFSGSLSPCGFFGSGTWTFDFGNRTWEQRRPKGDIPIPGPGIVSAYDPNTGKVFLDDGRNFYSYDVDRDRYEHLGGSNGIGYHSTAVIDPVRRKFVIVGAGRVHVYDVAKTGGFFGPRRRILGTKGGDPIVESSYPGLAFDPVSGRIVAWNGGDTVYSLDLEAATWTPITYPNGPGRAMPNGTYKRWSYAPGSGVFTVVNAMTGNAFTLRLAPALETPAR